MADQVHKVDYFYVTVPNRAGRGAQVLGALARERVNLLAYSGFPSSERGKSQIDLIPENPTALRRVARREGWVLSKSKRGFLIQGADRAGAVLAHVQRLGAAGINVTAADAACGGKGRYGMILWVKPKDYAKAARALRAR